MVITECCKCKENNKRITVNVCKQQVRVGECVVMSCRKNNGAPLKQGTTIIIKLLFKLFALLLLLVHLS